VYATGLSLAMNGLGTLAAASFGSCFPTTIYIGHPGWKALGARAGYSTLNGLVMAGICLTGTVSLISAVVPLEAGVAIVLWIGIVITAQAFQATPVRHAPAVAIGLFPAIAAFGQVVMAGAFIQASIPVKTAAVVDTAPAEVATQPAPRSAATMQDLLESPEERLGVRSEVNGFLVHGVNILERGYIFTYMIIAAVSAFLIDRRFRHAAWWSLAAAVLTFLGLMHAYQLTGNAIDYFPLPLFLSARPGAYHYDALPIAAGYVLFALIFFAAGRYHRGEPVPTADPLEDARAAPATTAH
jgi:AGZA family xanthine/uracil permease-like MFS transporter